MRELKGKGWSNVRIGELAGVSGVYIGSTLREDDPKPVSRKVWDALVAKTDLVPVDPGKSAKGQQTEMVSPQPPGTITIDAQLFSDLVEQVKTQTRLLNAVLDRLDRK